MRMLTAVETGAVPTGMMQNVVLELGVESSQGARALSGRPRAWGRTRPDAEDQAPRRTSGGPQTTSHALVTQGPGHTDQQMSSNSPES